MSTPLFSLNSPPCWHKGALCPPNLKMTPIGFSFPVRWKWLMQEITWEYLIHPSQEGEYLVAQGHREVPQIIGEVAEVLGFSQAPYVRREHACMPRRFSPVWLMQPCGLQPTRLFCPWHSPSKNTGVGCHALLQEIFLTQESNLLP